MLPVRPRAVATGSNAPVDQVATAPRSDTDRSDKPRMSGFLMPIITLTTPAGYTRVNLPGVPKERVLSVYPERIVADFADKHG